MIFPETDRTARTEPTELLEPIAPAKETDEAPPSLSSYTRVPPDMAMVRDNDNFSAFLMRHKLTSDRFFALNPHKPRLTSVRGRPTTPLAPNEVFRVKLAASPSTSPSSARHRRPNPMAPPHALVSEAPLSAAVEPSSPPRVEASPTTLEALLPDPGLPPALGQGVSEPAALAPEPAALALAKKRRGKAPLPRSDAKRRHESVALPNASEVSAQAIVQRIRQSFKAATGRTAAFRYRPGEVWTASLVDIENLNQEHWPSLGPSQDLALLALEQALVDAIARRKLPKLATSRASVAPSEPDLGEEL